MVRKVRGIIESHIYEYCSQRHSWQFLFVLLDCCVCSFNFCLHCKEGCLSLS